MSYFTPRRAPNSSPSKAFVITAKVKRWGEKMAPLFFLIVASLIFLITSINDRFEAKLRVMIADATAPILERVATPLKDAVLSVDAVATTLNAVEENAHLRAENERLRKWYQMALSLKIENEELKGMVNMVDMPERSYITTRIITDPTAPFLKTVLTPAGSKDGVKENHAAIAPEGLIGRVTDVGNKASRILMATDINSRIPVYIGDKKVRAILAGNNTHTPELDHVSRGAKLQAGDRVMTSGQGGIFASGVPVGVVEEITDNQVFVRLFADMNDLDYVQIVDFGLNRKVR